MISEMYIITHGIERWVTKIDCSRLLKMLFKNDNYDG